ncbi:hypothetical protein PVAND_013912 [Polypedilum vanderplanki]|uniref:SCP domain-containing protein n=1 Tax=Polypedilum vanderplanki TaxID=319348 RepID=A0A9J6CQT9_POLVA|nr:hypothetical protein PVAND_013912 [Polypedilum vanderplanki]
MFDIRPSAAELMITKHNEIRQLIASGNHDNFEKAARIPEIRWNDDLAYTAVCHVKTCMNGFDMCRNTLISRNVSQNIYRESNFTLTTIENLFSRAFNKWNKEAKIASLAHISKFIGSPNIGNFTQIIHETAYKMGCAAAWWTEFDKYEFEVVCNYNAGNSRGRKVYLAGDLKCTTGTSPKYPHLCSVDEPPVMQNCSLAFLNLCDDWCNKKLCPKKGPHICCNFKGKFASHCPRKIEILENTPEAIEVLLHEHNLVREKVASGKLKFDRAARMRVLTWSTKLAYLAECNIKSCLESHDKCRNTEELSYVNQNIYSGTALDPITPQTLYPRCLKKWFDEANKAGKSDLNNYQGKSSIGHFTQLIHETATEVGCATSWWPEGRKFGFKVTCNYNAGNFLGRKVYLPGRLNCTTGNSAKYPSLCSVNEPQISHDCSLAKA